LGDLQLTAAERKEKVDKKRAEMGKLALHWIVNAKYLH